MFYKKNPNKFIMKKNYTPNSIDSHSSTLVSYIKSISRYEVLTLAKEKEIIQEIENGNEESREGLIQGCLRFVIIIASRYSHLNIPIGDLINDGNVGLIKAAEKFDPQKGFRFLTFAHLHIAGSILSSIYVNASLIRVPKYITQKKSKIEKKLQEKLSGKTVTNSDLEVISDYNNFLKWKKSYPDYNIVDDYIAKDIANEDNPFCFINPEHKEEKLKKVLTSAILILPENERNVIILYFGLNSENKTETFQSISDSMGISKEGVRVIKIRALKKLREFLKSIDLEDYLDL